MVRASGCGLVMCQAVAHGGSGGSDVDHRSHPFEPVMAGLVKEVTDSDHARSFSEEVHGEPRRRAAEDANHRIQFLSATLQVGTSCGEVGATQSCSRDE